MVCVQFNDKYFSCGIQARCCNVLIQSLYSIVALGKSQHCLELHNLLWCLGASTSKLLRSNLADMQLRRGGLRFLVSASWHSGG
jgi:hypothetical protein